MFDYIFVLDKTNDISKRKELIDRISSKISKNNTKKFHVFNSNNSFGIQTYSSESFIDKDIFYNKGKNTYILSNTRIDNKEDLIERHPEIKELSQPEIILWLYEKYGDDIYELIEGPYSFLIKKENDNTIIGGRDLFGQRPMYYINSDKYFAVSSDANIFFQLDIQKEINQEKALQFIFNEHLKDGTSFYKGIKKINGGNFFSYIDNKILINKYLNPESLVTTKSVNKKTIIKDFKQTFKSTLTSILDNVDKNFATTLSGGLDSSSLYLAADKISSNKKIYTFSAHFNGISKKDFLKTDEEFYLNKVLLKGSSIHTRIQLNYNESGPINNKNKILPSSQPYGVINGYMHEAIYDECKNKNIEFLIDGLFGDEIISHGVFRLNELINRGNIFLFIYELLCLRRNKVIFSLRTQLNNFLFKPIKKVFESRFKLKKFRQAHLNDFSYLISDTLHNKFIYSYKESRAYYFKSDREEQFKLFNSGMIEFALEQLYEISNQRNIEKMYPFLDKRILKFALNVPTNMKLRNGVTRYYFKEGMKDLLPYELYKRQTKSNISPFANNQIQDNIDAILDEIFQNQSPVESYISKEKLNSFRNKKLNHAEMLIVYNLYNLNYWLKTQIN